MFSLYLVYVQFDVEFMFSLCLVMFSLVFVQFMFSLCGFMSGFSLCLVQVQFDVYGDVYSMFSLCLVYVQFMFSLMFSVCLKTLPKEFA